MSAATKKIVFDSHAILKWNGSENKKGVNEKQANDNAFRAILELRDAYRRQKNNERELI